MKKILSALLISLVAINTASAEWRTFNKLEPIKPNECDYRILTNQTNGGEAGAYNYYIYKSGDFLYMSKKSDSSTTIYLNFATDRSNQHGLSDLIDEADDKEGYLNMITNYNMRCDIHMQGTYFPRFPKKRGQQADSNQFYLECSGDGELDLRAAYRLNASKVLLQHNC